MGFTFNKGFNKEEKQKIIENLKLMFEIDDTCFDINRKGRTRNINIKCPECLNIRVVRLVDFLKTKGNLCNSCARKGIRNVSKREDVKKKLRRKGFKDTSYATLEWREKFSKSRTGEKNPKYGKPDSIETKRKKRIAALKNIEKNINNGGQIFPNYNPVACSIIEEYGEKHGYTFQHAENNGEHFIKELGYWVDVYDIERNTVIEVDENHHYDIDGNLLEKDQERQKEIVDLLKCNFVRVRI